MLKLDLGCGGSKREGFVGVDSLQLPGVDIVHDLTKYPYPFEDSTVSAVWMDNVLEHLPNPLRMMEEIYRICAPGAEVYIGVPYFRSFYSAIDPTHVNFFGVWWFNYFDPNHRFHHKYQYSKSKFKVENIEFDREFKKDKLGFFHKRMIRFAEKRPETYEARLSHLFPLNSLTFSLKVIK